MRFREYTPNYVRFLLYPKDWPEYGIGTIQATIDENINGYCATLNGNAYVFSEFGISRRKSNFVFRASCLEDKLCLRHLTHCLSKFYRIKPPDRNHIVDQICVLLESDVPLKIVRTDIERFFASIDFDRLLDKIETDGVLRTRDMAQLRSLGDKLKQLGGTGVPWGLSISSVLAEIYMREVDETCRRVSGIYYYARYVDDIIIFSARSAEEALNSVSSAISKIGSGLRLNRNKTKMISEADLPFSKPTQFEYLGYRFRRLARSRKKCDISISLAEKKFRKIKYRIDQAFDRFDRRKENQDLKDRIRILTGNCSFQKSRHAAPIRIGVYANYPKMTDIRQMAILDDYLRQRLHRSMAATKGLYFGYHVKKLRLLFKYSFRQGFEKRLTHNLSRLRIQHAYKIWQQHGN